MNEMIEWGNLILRHGITLGSVAQVMPRVNELLHWQNTHFWEYRKIWLPMKIHWKATTEKPCGRRIRKCNIMNICRSSQQALKSCSSQRQDFNLIGCCLSASSHLLYIQIHSRIFSANVSDTTLNVGWNMPEGGEEGGGEGPYLCWTFILG